MPDFNPFDMDFDGDVDGIDFVGFHCLAEHTLKPGGLEAEESGGANATHCGVLGSRLSPDDSGEDEQNDCSWHDSDIHVNVERMDPIHWNRV